MGCDIVYSGVFVRNGSASVFCPEDRGSRLLRTVVKNLPDLMILLKRRPQRKFLAAMDTRNIKLYLLSM